MTHKVSFSSYKEFTSCGEKWKLKRLDKVEVPERPAAWTVMGNAYHKAIEDYELNLRKDDVLDLFNAAWDAELIDQIDRQADFGMWELTPRVKDVQRDLDLRLEKGRQQAKNYVIRADQEANDWHVAHRGGKVLAELDFEIEIAGVLVRGYIDQIREWNGALVAVDLKTGNPGNTDPRQLGLYTWAASKVLGEPVQYGRMFYSKLDSEPRSGDMLGRYGDWVDGSLYSDVFWENQFLAMQRGISSGSFLPNVSDLCNRCEVKSNCKAWIGISPTTSN